MGGPGGAPRKNCGEESLVDCPSQTKQIRAKKPKPTNQPTHQTTSKQANLLGEVSSDNFIKPCRSNKRQVRSSSARKNRGSSSSETKRTVTKEPEPYMPIGANQSNQPTKLSSTLKQFTALRERTLQIRGKLSSANSSNQSHLNKRYAT